MNPTLQAIQAIGTLVLSTATCIVLFLSWRLSRQSKEADVLMEVNRRFDRVWEIRHDPQFKDRPAAYWDKFWSLQWDQFCHWRNGFIPDRDFEFWMNSRHDDFLANGVVHTETYQQSWERCKKGFRDADFVAFIDQVHSASFSQAKARLR